MAEARSQYINGVETLGEIAERMEMHPSDVRREASNGDWKLLRDERKKEMELEIHHKSSKELKSRQIEFQRRTEVILGKMLNLADMKVDALIANESDQLGQKPTYADVQRVVASVATMVATGRKMLRMDVEEKKADPVNDAIDVTPVD